MPRKKVGTTRTNVDGVVEVYRKRRGWVRATPPKVGEIRTTKGVREVFRPRKGSRGMWVQCGTRLATKFEDVCQGTSTQLDALTWTQVITQRALTTIELGSQFCPNSPIVQQLVGQYKRFVFDNFAPSVRECAQQVVNGKPGCFQDLGKLITVFKRFDEQVRAQLAEVCRQEGTRVFDLQDLDEDVAVLQNTRTCRDERIPPSIIDWYTAQNAVKNKRVVCRAKSTKKLSPGQFLSSGQVVYIVAGGWAAVGSPPLDIPPPMNAVSLSGIAGGLNLMTQSIQLLATGVRNIGTRSVAVLEAVASSKVWMVMSLVTFLLASGLFVSAASVAAFITAWNLQWVVYAAQTLRGVCSVIQESFVDVLVLLIVQVALSVVTKMVNTSNGQKFAFFTNLVTHSLLFLKIVTPVCSLINFVAGLLPSPGRAAIAIARVIRNNIVGENERLQSGALEAKVAQSPVFERLFSGAPLIPDGAASSLVVKPTVSSAVSASFVPTSSSALVRVAPGPRLLGDGASALSAQLALPSGPPVLRITALPVDVEANIGVIAETFSDVEIGASLPVVSFTESSTSLANNATEAGSFVPFNPPPDTVDFDPEQLIRDINDPAKLATIIANAGAANFAPETTGFAFWGLMMNGLSVAVEGVKTRGVQVAQVASIGVSCVDNPASCVSSLATALLTTPPGQAQQFLQYLPTGLLSSVSATLRAAGSDFPSVPPPS